MNSYEYVQNVQGGRRSDIGDITTAAVATGPVPPQPVTPSGVVERSFGPDVLSVMRGTIMADQVDPDYVEETGPGVVFDLDGGAAALRIPADGVAVTDSSLVAPVGNNDGAYVPDAANDADQYGFEQSRVVEFSMPEDEIEYFIDRDYSFVVRLMKVGSRATKSIAFKLPFFLKGPDGNMYRNEFGMSTNMRGDLYQNLRVRLNTFLSSVMKGERAEELHDSSGSGAAIYCKSLRQMDLLDIRTDIDRVANPGRSDVGGTRQDVVPICSTVDLIVALNKVAYRDSYHENAYTQTSQLSSFVLDLLVKVCWCYRLSLLLKYVI